MAKRRRKRSKGKRAGESQIERNARIRANVLDKHNSEPIAVQLTRLSDIRHFLGERDRAFAESLMQQFNRNYALSPRQEPYVSELIARAIVNESEQERTRVIESRRKKRADKRERKAKSRAVRRAPIQCSLYVFRYKDHVKIGIAKNTRKRMSGLRVGIPDREHLELLCEQTFENRATAAVAERKMHKACNRYRASGEWFTLDALSIYLETYPDCKRYAALRDVLEVDL